MKKSILTIGLLSVTLSLLAACAQRPKTVEADAVKTEVQQVENVQADLAPDFELPDLQGNPLKLSSLRGKYVVLDFWGSWCIWCIRGIPHMKEAYRKYKDKMEILGVDCQDTEEKWKAAVEEHQLPWLQVRCPEDYLQTLGQQYRIQGFPTKVIIDPEGRLVKVVVGEDPAFYTFLDQLFAK
jgi:thiol-disulfide isomerase/thioredoxin